MKNSKETAEAIIYHMEEFQKIDVESNVLTEHIRDMIEIYSKQQRELLTRQAIQDINKVKDFDKRDVRIILESYNRKGELK